MPLMLNNVQLGGNLTRDPEMRNVGSESKVASFGLAINRKYKSGGETKEDVTFVDVECWNRQAELVCQYLAKGRNVLIEGSLKLNQWESEGVKRSKLTVTAYRVHFIGTGENKDGNAAHSAPVAPSEPIDDEPPF